MMRLLVWFWNRNLPAATITSFQWGGDIYFVKKEIEPCPVILSTICFYPDRFLFRSFLFFISRALPPSNLSGLYLTVHYSDLVFLILLCI